jgi:hypothetical protein
MINQKRKAGFGRCRSYSDPFRLINGVDNSTTNAHMVEPHFENSSSTIATVPYTDSNYLIEGNPFEFGKIESSSLC